MICLPMRVDPVKIQGQPTNSAEARYDVDDARWDVTFFCQAARKEG